MRFLLINPFYPISETPSPPLGLSVIAATLEAARIDVRILDLVVTPYSKAMLAEVLADFRPQFVGLTAVTMTYDNALDVIRDVKALDPDIITVMGGPHITFQAREALAAVPELDVCVLGEGEQTVAELAKAGQNSSKWEAIAGLAFRQNGGFRMTPRRPPIQDLNQLPLPARHLVPLGRYRALGMCVSMTTSRGCPFKCIFCVGRKMVGAKVRYRDPRIVVDEMEILNTYGFPQINLADDLFTANEPHCLAVCDEIARRGLAVRWTSFARVDTVTPRMLTAMKAAGCHTVSFGVESGNDAILKTVRKGITTRQVLAAAQMVVDAGILCHASFILGLPGETPETIAETMAFGDRLGDMGAYYGFHVLAPFPGTRVRENCQEYGIRILTDDWREYHANRAVTETQSVSRDMVDEIVEAWHRKFDDFLDQVKEQRRQGTAPEKDAQQLIGLERIVTIYDLMMNQALETCGAWSLNGHKGADSDAALLENLSSRVAETVEHPMVQIHDALAMVHAKGDLVCRRKGRDITWQWNDYL